MSRRSKNLQLIDFEVDKKRPDTIPVSGLGEWLLWRAVR